MKCSTCITIFIAFVAILIAYVYLKPETPVVLHILDNPWWSSTPPEKANNDSSIRPFKVHVEQHVLDDLKVRLNNIRSYPSSIPGWEYGTNADYILPLMKYWKNDYDWRKQEKLINTFNHFKTKMYGIDIHFIHAFPNESAKANSVPTKVILLVHGWPGSVFEFYKAIPLLTQRGYIVVVPSLPGFGFSDPPQVSGLGITETARLFAELMDRLGYDKYYVQGGDWGAAVVENLAVLYPRHCRGVHTNFVVMISPTPIYTYGVGSFFPSLVFPDPEDRKRFLPVLDHVLEGYHEFSYYMLQSTRPDSIGFAFNDSPLGLASWITEKFVRWSGCAQTNDTSCIEGKFTKDELLTNIMIYWTTQSITTSMRYYKEFLNNADDIASGEAKILIPSAIADFPHEMARPHRSWISHRYKQLISYTSMPDGGHFAAFEKPDLLIPDVINFMTKTEELYAQGKIVVPTND